MLSGELFEIVVYEEMAAVWGVFLDWGERMSGADNNNRWEEIIG